MFSVDNVTYTGSSTNGGNVTIQEQHYEVPDLKTDSEPHYEFDNGLAPPLPTINYDQYAQHLNASQGPVSLIIAIVTYNVSLIIYHH